MWTFVIKCDTSIEDSSRHRHTSVIAEERGPLHLVQREYSHEVPNWDRQSAVADERGRPHLVSQKYSHDIPNRDTKNANHSHTSPSWLPLLTSGSLLSFINRLSWFIYKNSKAPSRALKTPRLPLQKTAPAPQLSIQQKTRSSYQTSLDEFCVLLTERSLSRSCQECITGHLTLPGCQEWTLQLGSMIVE